MTDEAVADEAVANEAAAAAGDVLAVLNDGAAGVVNAGLNARGIRLQYFGDRMLASVPPITEQLNVA